MNKLKNKMSEIEISDDAQKSSIFDKIKKAWLIFQAVP